MDYMRAAWINFRTRGWFPSSAQTGGETLGKLLPLSAWAQQHFVLVHTGREHFSVFVLKHGRSSARRE